MKIDECTFQTDELMLFFSIQTYPILKFCYIQFCMLYALYEPLSTSYYYTGSLIYVQITVQDNRQQIAKLTHVCNACDSDDSSRSLFITFDFSFAVRSLAVLGIYLLGHNADEAFEVDGMIQHIMYFALAALLLTAHFFTLTIQ